MEHQEESKKRKGRRVEVKLLRWSRSLEAIIATPLFVVATVGSPEK
jgi:hypothetical protein